MFEFSQQERRQFMLAGLFVAFFLVTFALAAVTLLVPDAAVSLSQVSAVDIFGAPTVAALLAAVGGLFALTNL